MNAIAELPAGILHKRIGTAQPIFNNSAMQIDGIWNSLFTDFSSVWVPGTAEGPHFNQSTDATTDSDAHITFGTFTGTPLHDPSNNIRAQWRFSIDDYTNVRIPIGFSGATASNNMGDDDPPGGVAMLQFSTARGDTNWQFHTRPIFGPETLIDSGIVPVADAIYTIEIEVTTDFTRFILYDKDLTVLADKVSTTNLLDQVCQFFAGVRTLNATAKTISHYGGMQVGEA